MYIYAPGAGCTGEAKLVTPGDELIFSTSSQWHQKDAPLLSQVEGNAEEKLVSTCLAARSEPSRSYNMPLPKDALTELAHKNFSSETLKKVRWVRKMYRKWRSYRHSLGLEFITCDLEDHATVTVVSLQKLRNLMAPSFLAKLFMTLLSVCTSTLNVWASVSNLSMMRHSVTSNIL